MISTRSFLRSLALVAAAMPLGTMLSPARAANDKVQMMFVQPAEALKAHGQTLRLVNVPPKMYFSDRPKRVAGHVAMPAFQARPAMNVDREAA